MFKELRRMLCKHDYRFNRKLYGDEINAHNGKRFEYVCVKCGFYQWFMHPLNCQGCKHIWYNSGGEVKCDIEPKDRYCMSAFRVYFEEDDR